jgi:hypothetical protein
VKAFKAQNKSGLTLQKKAIKLYDKENNPNP